MSNNTLSNKKILGIIASVAVVAIGSLSFWGYMAWQEKQQVAEQLALESSQAAAMQAENDAASKAAEQDALRKQEEALRLKNELHEKQAASQAMADVQKELQAENDQKAVSEEDQYVKNEDGSVTVVKPEYQKTEKEKPSEPPKVKEDVDLTDPTSKPTYESEPESSQPAEDSKPAESSKPAEPTPKPEETSKPAEPNNPTPVPSNPPKDDTPQGGETNNKGEVYVPGFGWIKDERTGNDGGEKGTIEAGKGEIVGTFG